VPDTPLNPAVESISAFFPCFNDEPTIATMVNALVKTLETIDADGEVIVVNDGSTDGSQEVLEELADVQPALRIVVHEHNRGYGGALLSGFAAATKQWVFYTDGDGQFDPTELALLVEGASEDVDVVQGYKIRRADNIARRIIGRVYHRFVSALFGLRIRDVDCDFRLIRRSLLQRVRLTQTSGVICVEMIRKFQDAGARFVEVPVHHYSREHGKSRFFRPASVARSLWDLTALWVRLVLLRRGAGAQRRAERAPRRSCCSRR
jgi:cellulose synthase/poly-beta-1,6-N-acetylglucosamine synthase-like glycosyltransferase